MINMDITIDIPNEATFQMKVFEEFSDLITSPFSCISLYKIISSLHKLVFTTRRRHTFLQDSFFAQHCNSFSLFMTSVQKCLRTFLARIVEFG